MSEMHVTDAMDAMDAMDATTSETLNGLLEDERAAVEALVGLVAMATDGLERQAMVVFGGQTAQACHELRALLNRHGATVSARVGPGKHIILGQERYDDRLRSYSLLQQSLADRIEALMAGELDADAQAVLAPLRSLHLAHHAWALTRADDFTASREAANEQARQANPHLAGNPPRSDSVTPLSERPAAERAPVAEPEAAEPAPPRAETPAPSAPATSAPATSAPPAAPHVARAALPRLPLKLPVSKTALTAPPPPKLIEPPASAVPAPAEPAAEPPQRAPRGRRPRARPAEGAGNPTGAPQP